MDKNTALEIVSKRGRSIRSLPNNLKQNRNVRLAAVKKNWNSLIYENGTYSYSDKELALAAIEQHPGVIASLSEELKNDEDIVLKGVMFDAGVILYAGRTLIRIPFLLKAVEVNPEVVAFSKNFFDLNDITKYNKYINFVKDALKINGLALQYTLRELKNDPEVVLIAFRQNENSLQFTEAFVKDPEIFLMEMFLKGMRLSKVEKERIKDKAKELLVLENSLLSNTVPGTRKSLNKLKNQGPIFEKLFLKRIKSYGNKRLSNKELNVLKHFRRAVPFNQTRTRLNVIKENREGERENN
jgi:hypothetical protein